MSRLTRDGTAETVSRDQILRHELNADRGIFIFPVQLTTSRIGNLTRFIHTLAICVTIHCRKSAGTGPVNLNVVPNECCCLATSTMGQLICASLSHTHYYWYEVGMLKVPAKLGGRTNSSSSSSSQRGVSKKKRNKYCSVRIEHQTKVGKVRSQR